MASLLKAIAIVSLLQLQLSAADGFTPFDRMLQRTHHAVLSDDLTSMLQVKQEVKAKRSESKQAQAPAVSSDASLLQKAQVPVRTEPPQVVFESPPMLGDFVAARPVVEGGLPESAALNSMGYPIAAGYPVSAYAGYPMGGYPVPGNPAAAAAAHAAQIGANNVVAQTASTMTQAANVAENSAVAAASLKNPPPQPYSPYYAQVAPGYSIGGGYPTGAVYPTFAQQMYPMAGGYPSYAQQPGYPSYAQQPGSAYAAGAYGYPYAAGAYGSAAPAQTYGYPYAAASYGSVAPAQTYVSVVP